MTTRRDVMLGIAALPLVGVPAMAAEQPTVMTHAYGMSRWVWLLTRQQIVDTPQWGSPSVWPSLLDSVGYHKMLPSRERPEVLALIRERFRHPYLAQRWSPERDLMMVVVGEHEDVYPLEQRWREDGYSVADHADAELAIAVRRARHNES